MLLLGEGPWVQTVPPAEQSNALSQEAAERPLCQEDMLKAG